MFGVRREEQRKPVPPDLDVSVGVRIRSRHVHAREVDSGCRHVGRHAQSLARRDASMVCRNAHRRGRSCAGSVIGGRRVVQDDAQEGVMHLDAAAVVVDEAEFSELVHEEIDAGAGRPDHFREHFL